MGDPREVGSGTPGPGRQLLDALERFRAAIALVLLLAAAEAGLFLFGPAGTLGAALMAALLAAGAAAALRLRGAVAGRRVLPRLGMRQLMMLIVGAAVALQLAATFGEGVLLLALMALPPVLVVAGTLALWGGREAQREALLSVLALAARQGMPPGPAVGAFAGLCRGRMQTLVRALAAELDSGAGLPEALDRVPGVLPLEAEAAARAGWRSGALAGALESAAVAHAAARVDAPPPRALIAYPLAVIYGVIVAALFLLIHMRPRMRAIFGEFRGEVPVPAATALDSLGTLEWALSPFLPGTVEVGAWALLASALIGVPVFGALVGLGWLAWLGLGLAARALAGTADAALGAASGRRPLARAAAPPGVRRDAPAILRGLAAGVEGGRPLPEALADLDARGLARSARARLRAARRDLLAGRPWADALRDRGLVGPADAAVLESAARAGNLAWALRDRADAAGRRRNYRRRAAARLLYPLAMVALGGVVLLFGLVYYQPLAALIAAMAEDL